MKYTEEMLDFLRLQYNKGNSWHVICDSFNQRYNVKKVPTNIRNAMLRHRPGTIACSLLANRRMGIK